MLLLWLAVFSTWTPAAALSYAPTGELGYVAAVEALSHVESCNGLTLELKVAGNRHLSNIERRWFVQADPNNADTLRDQWAPHASSGSDSLALYNYLTRNDSTIEIPHRTLNFKFTLAPQDSDWLQLETSDGELDETLAVLEGNAYRSVRTVVQNRETVAFKPTGWARFVVSNTTSEPIAFSGSWLVDDESGLGMPATVFHLTTVEHLRALLGPERQGMLRDWPLNQMVVWRDFDMATGPLNHMETFGNGFEFLDLLDKEHSPRLFQRDADTTGGYVSGINLYQTIGDTSGCPSRRMVSLTGLAVDCNFMTNFNSTQSLRSYLLDTVSQASRFYESAFNITLGLKQIVMPNSSDCSASEFAWNYACVANSSAISDRLGSFSSWRKTRGDDGIATWSLFTDCRQGGVVGLAWEGLVCQAGGVSVVTHTMVDSRVLAHEIGHSYGAVHDCDSSACSTGADRTSDCCPLANGTCNANGAFIMNPSASSSQQGFSACTQGNVCSAIGRRTVNSTCLMPNSGGISLITENVCGNGIVEDGEECDCGGVDGCAGNTCCDPTTCKFTTGSQCDDVNDQCCNQCKYASADTVCREATGPCDFTLYCPGNSTTCPATRIEQDGKACSLPNSNATNLQCISGHCTSRDLQCVTLMSNRTLSSAGNPLTMIRACSDDSTCQLSCIDQNYGNSVCFRTSQNFMDGTPCSGSGRCSGGRCIGGSSNYGGVSGNDDDSSGFWWWKYVVIVICAVFGASFFLWFIMAFVRRRRERPGGHNARPPAQPYRVPPAPPFGPPPPSMRTSNYAPPPPRYDNSSYYPPPPDYVPAYDQSAPNLSSASTISPPPMPPPAARRFKPDGTPVE